MKKILIIVLGGVFITQTYANNLTLNKFLAQAKTIQANFTQTVTTGKKTKVSTGTMEIARPNKFKWQYVNDKQLIISDAKNIYIYDEPLQQVTVKKLDQSIDKSPAAILAGAGNIYNLYNVSNLDLKESNLAWIQIVPKKINDNNGFEKIIMGFDGSSQLSQMRFIDNFGNNTLLTFNNVKTGIKLPDSDFKFKLPTGVDVVQQ